MRRIFCRIISDRRNLLLGLLAVPVLAACVFSQVTTHPVDWVGGDVFAASGGGSYKLFHSANPSANNPTYTNEQTISDGNGGATGGCGVDLAGRFFGTNIANTLVDRYSVAFAHGVVQQLPNSSTGRASQSVALDATTNLFVGYAGGASGGFGTIEQWTKNTSTGLYAFNKSFSVPVDGTAGPGWIDLAADGHTIFYTAQTRKIYKFDSSVAVSAANPVVWADLSTLNGQNKFGTLFAIKILGSHYDGTDGVLVADQGNVKVIKASAGVITSFQVFKFNPLSNLQALTLDSFHPLTTAWVGDATATSQNLLRFNISTGSVGATISTGAGVGGVCLDFGFNGAQLAFQPSNPNPNFQTQVFNLTKPTPNNPTSNTFSFSSKFTSETLTATLPNLKNPVAVTIFDALVDSSVALSDPTVFAVNPGAPAGQIVPGNMPCDQTLTTAAGFPGTCEEIGFWVEPNSGFDLPDIQINTTLPGDLGPANGRGLTNLDEDATMALGTYPFVNKNCTLTINQQKEDSNFQVCPNGFTFSTSKNQGGTINFTLDVAATGSCGNNQTTPNFLLPLLLIVQEQSPDPGTGITPAPVSIPVLIAGNSGGPPVMPLSGQKYQLQVKTTNMPPGFTYHATVIDLSGTIESVTADFTTN